ncbi:MAG TPA: ABC transporter substrate-binding protein [Chloroflexota bacterium]|nr:ABC transporter substrate-binding protein [Chloroflexota bacterium]
MLILLGACGQTAPVPQEKLTITYSGSNAQFALLWEAKETGLFQKEGLDADLVQTRGGSEAMQALVAGSAQFSMAGASTLIEARGAGAGMLLVATAVPKMTSQIAVRQGIESPRDLRGKKLGIVSRGGTTDIEARWFLQSNGLKPDSDVTMVPLGGGAQLAAGLSSGVIDAAAISFLPGSAIRAVNGKILADLSQVGPTYEGQNIGTTRALVKSRPELVRRFMRAYVAAIHTFKMQKQLTIDTLRAHKVSDDPEELEQLYTKYAENIFPRAPYVSEEGLQTAMAGVPGAKAASLQPSDLIDNRFVKELDDTGYIAKLYGA